MQQLFHGITTLTKLVGSITEPAAALLYDTQFHTHVDDLAHLRNAFAKNNIEFGGTEWRSHLVLYDLYLHPVAHRFFAILDLRHAPDIEPDRGIEFKGITTGGRLGISKHDTDLFPELVDEDTDGIGLADRSRELSERL